jgi:hypothetical protein
MVASFDNLATEVRLMIYEDVLSGRRFHRSLDNTPLAPEDPDPIISMLHVSRLHRNETVLAINMYVNFVLPQVSKVQAFCKARSVA